MAVNPLRVCTAASRRQPSIRCLMQPDESTENHMYIGGILGTILIIALIVYFVRRV
jgi:nitrate reductase gamma subunit